MGEDRKLYATDIHASSTFEFGMTHSLFELHGRAYVPARDGERFLVNMSSDAASLPINIVVNWTAALNKK